MTLPKKPDVVRPTLRSEVKSSLARWVLQRRRVPGLRFEPASHDEAMHAWDGRRRFGEDYTFAAVQDGLAIVLRLEWLPGRDAERVWVIVLEPGAVYSLPRGQRIVRATLPNRWRAAGLEIDCTTPLRTWQLGYVGSLEAVRPGRIDGTVLVGDPRRVRLELEFVADAAPFSPGTDDDPELMAARLGEATWDRTLLRSVRRAQTRGYVQTGTLVGTLVLGDVLVPVQAACLRQHSWGVRDWGASDEAFQCFFTAPGGRTGWVHHARFPFVTLEGGFVHAPERTGQGEGFGVPLEPVQTLVAVAEPVRDRAPPRIDLDVTWAHGDQRIAAHRRSDVVFSVDGRGELELALLELTDGRGWGIWAGQRRVLPRR